MTSPGGKDELARTLRELRAAAGLSTREAGSRAGWSQAKISRLETGRNIPNPHDTAVLAEVYQADPATRARLEQLASNVKAWSRRVYLNRGNDESQRALARVEQSSALVRTYSPAVIPGLLQTAAYARAIFQAYGSKPRTAEQLEAAIAMRLERQEQLGQEGHEFVLITTEGALGWMATSPAVMVEQLEHIAALDKPGVRVGVIPWGTPATVFPLHTWDMFDNRAVSFGTVASTALLTATHDVAAYDAIFGQLEQMAVFGDEAGAVLAHAAERYRALMARP
jgi:transcriptional regulator with XRE-family HTH domain